MQRSRQRRVRKACLHAGAVWRPRRSAAAAEAQRAAHAPHCTRWFSRRWRDAAVHRLARRRGRRGLLQAARGREGGGAGTGETSTVRACPQKVRGALPSPMPDMPHRQTQPTEGKGGSGSSTHTGRHGGLATEGFGTWGLRGAPRLACDSSSSSSRGGGGGGGGRHRAQAALSLREIRLVVTAASLANAASMNADLALTAAGRQAGRHHSLNLRSEAQRWVSRLASAAASFLRRRTKKTAMPAGGGRGGEGEGSVHRGRLQAPQGRRACNSHASSSMPQTGHGVRTGQGSCAMQTHLLPAAGRRPLPQRCPQSLQCWCRRRCCQWPTRARHCRQ